MEQPLLFNFNLDLATVDTLTSAMITLTEIISMKTHGALTADVFNYLVRKVSTCQLMHGNSDFDLLSLDPVIIPEIINVQPVDLPVPAPIYAKTRPLLTIEVPVNIEEVIIEEPVIIEEEPVIIDKPVHVPVHDLLSPINFIKPANIENVSQLKSMKVTLVKGYISPPATPDKLPLPKIPANLTPIPVANNNLTPNKLPLPANLKFIKPKIEPSVIPSKYNPRSPLIIPYKH